MEITEVKQHRSKVEITFENGEKLFIAKTVWEKTPFSKGVKITENERENLINEDEIFSIKASALRILSRREHSRKELRTKLLVKGFAQKNVDYVLNLLEADNFLNDERFAELYVAFAVKSRKKTPRVIRYELAQKGIDNLLIDKYLNEISEDEIYNNAFELGLKKAKINLRKGKEKALLSVRNHLLYKAYPSEIVNKVLTELKERLGA